MNKQIYKHQKGPLPRDNIGNPTRFTKISAAYCNLFPLRAAIQGLPMVGGSVDTLFAGLGAKYQYERLDKFLHLLNDKLQNLENKVSTKEFVPSEPLFDFIVQIFDQIIRNRSELKRDKFVNIITHQIITQTDWDEAETACRLLGELSDIHIQLLITILDSKISLPKNRQTFTFSDKVEGSNDLRKLIPNISTMAIRMACSDSKGVKSTLDYIRKT